jgi:hypothetical protein
MQVSRDASSPVRNLSTSAIGSMRKILSSESYVITRGTDCIESHSKPCLQVPDHRLRFPVRNVHVVALHMLVIVVAIVREVDPT